MTTNDLLIMLMADLGEPNASTARKTWLELQINAAIAFIRTEGVQLSAPYSVEDGALIIMYAAYLVRKRDTTEAMPRMLRWALNNRIFKATAEASE